MQPFDRDSGRRAPLRRSQSEPPPSLVPLLRTSPQPVPQAVTRPKPRSRRHALAGWLVAPLALVSVAAGVWLVVEGPQGLFGVVFGGALALGLVWVLACSLFPATADRTCPECKRPGLVRLDRRTTRGVRCARCGFRDATASSFLLAEDEGVPLESTVFHERDRGRE
ncbi:MAG: NAD(P)(+) transhydrogenase (Re/Si-specific) subunit beta [Planctomycetes bacterium]|nr:NAD(P)(+) transhydrogenase (Re/Si-specific) subunit beta [Planctomycetota bacterium]